MRTVSGPGLVPSAILRIGCAETSGRRINATLVLLNSSFEHQPPPAMDPAPSIAGAAFADPDALENVDPTVPLAPGEVRLVALTRTQAVADRSKRGCSPADYRVEIPPHRT